MICSTHSGDKISLTAATRNQAFEIMYGNKLAVRTINNIMSAAAIKQNKHLIEDIKQEYFIHLHSKYKEDDEFLEFFNSDFFLFSTQRWFRNILSNTKTKLIVDYHEGKYQQSKHQFVDIWDQDGYVQQQDEQDDSALSILQYIRLIEHILRSTRASTMSFKEKDIKNFIELYILPHAEGKKITMKEAISKKNLSYRSTVERFSKMKSFVRDEIKFFFG